MWLHMQTEIILIYNIFDASEGNKNVIFPMENVVFSLWKIFLSDEKIIAFERYNAPWCPKAGTSDVNLQYKSRHFKALEKPKIANLING